MRITVKEYSEKGYTGREVKLNISSFSLSINQTKNVNRIIDYGCEAHVFFKNEESHTHAIKRLFDNHAEIAKDHRVKRAGAQGS